MDNYSEDQRVQKQSADGEQPLTPDRDDHAGSRGIDGNRGVPPIQNNLESPTADAVERGRPMSRFLTSGTLTQSAKLCPQPRPSYDFGVHGNPRYSDDDDYDAPAPWEADDYDDDHDVGTDDERLDHDNNEPDDYQSQGRIDAGNQHAPQLVTTIHPPVLGPQAAASPFDTSALEAHCNQIASHLRLLMAPDQIVELRALDVVTPSYRRPHVVSGFFDAEHVEQMARHALELSAEAKGIYVTMNPLNRDLLSRRHNRVDTAEQGLAAADKDVLCRHWLLIDVDPVRIAGVSSTNAEKAHAYAKILEIRTVLNGFGWPRPVLADSGNGYHLLYRIELPSEDGGLVKGVLHALGDRFDDEVVKVDPSVFNPARIVKLYGTKACKGDDTHERPHRWSGIIEVPEQLTVVPKAQMQALAAPVPVYPTASKAAGSPAPQQPDKRSAVQARAREYLAKIPPAVAGNHGHDQTFHAACVLAQGFALSVEEAMPLLEEYNQKCQPPWSEEELLHKLADAAKKEGARGHLLGKAPAGNTELAGGFRAEFLTCMDLERTAGKPRWLVKRILVADQPAVVGGPKKVLKTSLILDLAISLATGTRFLREFEVPQAVKVAVLSGESGKSAILDAARRICRAKNVDFHSCGVLWGFELPRLSSEADMATLGAALVEHGIEVVIIDPLYLCLLAGDTQGRQAGNMFDMGPLLLRVAQACLAAGATPVLVHHARKQNQNGRAKGSEPLDLEDLAFSGVAEFARQWVLLSRREKFDPDVGKHELWLSVGGSAGHAGLYGVDVREGVMDDGFGGREWQVTVYGAPQIVQGRQRAKAAEKTLAKDVEREAEQQKVVNVLNGATVARTVPDIADAAGVSKDKTRKRLAELLQRGVVVRTNVPKAFGSGKTKQPGWLLWRNEVPLTPEQMSRLRNGTLVEDVLGTGASSS